MPIDVLTRSEAEARAAKVSAVSYTIQLDLIAGAKDYAGVATIRFSGSEATFLEFLGGAIESMTINGAPHEPAWDGVRIDLPADLLAASNEITISYRKPYDHSGEGFHQFVDPTDGAEYLYTQFEPYSAHRLFPCFDQPDLKATYLLTVTAPVEWKIISAGRIVGEEEASEGRTISSFEETVRFSTYLFSVIAGPWHEVAGEHNGLPMSLYTRHSMAQFIDADEIFHLTKGGMDFFGSFFGREYPFTKYDQMFVPEFNWGGMENVAAVTYTDGLIFRDPPTRDQRIRRAEIILHELAHMWFGDLVTMQWWNDLWLNESFATFAAYLAIDDTGEWGESWQDFNTRNKLTAYRDDQQPTTHPIVATVETTDEVFLNFDMITYGKGASTLRQLVATIGLEAFSKGLQTYFRRYEFGNTTLPDFLGALQEGAGRDLAKWASLWLATANVNTLEATWETSGDLLSKMTVHQRAPDDYPTLRPHTVEVGLIEEGAGNFAVRGLPLTIDGAAEQVSSAVGAAIPAAVFPNYGDLTYAKVALDPVSLDFVRGSLRSIDDPLLRHQLWQSLWEMVRDRQLSSLDYLDMMQSHLVSESSDQIIRMVSLTSGGTLRRFVPERVKAERVSAFAAMCRRALEAAPPGDLRVLWGRSLAGTASSHDDLKMVAELFDGGVEGMAIDQDMRWSVALRWSAFGVDGATDRVAAELEKDPTDRGERAALRAEVARPDPETKEEAWEKIHNKGYDSLAKVSAAMTGFAWSDQAELLAPYASDFFVRVEDVMTDWEWEAAKAYYYGLHPSYRIDDENLARTRVLAKASDPRLKRLAIESIADLERAMACRALAETQLSPEPEDTVEGEDTGTGTIEPA
ncbi:MAG: aminopeptidase N [Acidimicrobiia bacterium]